MIETNYHLIPEKIYSQIITEAQKIDVSIDYFLMEFCEVQEGGTPKVDL